MSVFRRRDSVFCLPDSGVFGVSLNSLLDNDRKRFPGVKVPVFFQKVKTHQSKAPFFTLQRYFRVRSCSATAEHSQHAL